MIPIHVISKPDAHQERMVISDFNAPTAKWAAKLMAQEAITAAMPPKKKNGTIGTKAPVGVEMAQDNEAFQKSETRSSNTQSSFCALACPICPGSSGSRSAILCD